ncbi:hypothetical protein [Fructilactobacillus fructivorans]|uniref:hypothetical protein n=1 Tax=Fructilactobacillus fructivorans TaxID=1614 RepID=UPI0012E94160|nr:hypothetical protein [Fructilactobacillus fructivorans]
MTIFKELLELCILVLLMVLTLFHPNPWVGISLNVILIMILWLFPEGSNKINKFFKYIITAVFLISIILIVAQMIF